MCRKPTLEIKFKKGHTTERYVRRPEKRRRRRWSLSVLPRVGRPLLHSLLGNNLRQAQMPLCYGGQSMCLFEISLNFLALQTQESFPQRDRRPRLRLRWFSRNICCPPLKSPARRISCLERERDVRSQKDDSFLVASGGTRSTDRG